jgi:hypothetical protein
MYIIPSNHVSREPEQKFRTSGGRGRRFLVFLTTPQQPAAAPAVRGAARCAVSLFEREKKKREGTAARGAPVALSASCKTLAPYRIKRDHPATCKRESLTLSVFLFLRQYLLVTFSKRIVV